MQTDGRCLQQGLVEGQGNKRQKKKEVMGERKMIKKGEKLNNTSEGGEKTMKKCCIVGGWIGGMAFFSGFGLNSRVSNVGDF